MKKISLLFGLMILAVTAIAQNPFISGQFTADPSAHIFNGRIYVYPSHDIPAPADKPHLRKDWFCMADYHVFSSDNLVDWTDHGVIVTQEKVDWVNPDAYTMWAPDAAYRNGKYYFYFPAVAKPDSTIQGFGTMIGVAISDRPDGDFVPEKTPIKGVYGIDPCVMIDDDGQAYIYWAGRGLQGAKLKDNMLELASEPIVIEKLPDGMKEGPFVFKRKGKYYFTFPWVPKDGQTETLAYAMGDSPLGPFEYKGLIMDMSPTGCWTNHHSFIEWQGQWYLFYHHNDYSPTFDKNRSIRIDKMYFNSDGTIQKVIPTLRGVGITKATDKIQLDRYSKISGSDVAIEILDTLNTFAGWKTYLSAKGAYVQYNDVDFGKTKLTKAEAKIIKSAGATLAVKVNGKTVAEIVAPQNAEAAEISVPLKSAPTGIHNVSLEVKDGSNVEVDWIRFF